MQESGTACFVLLVLVSPVAVPVVFLYGLASYLAKVVLLVTIYSTLCMWIGEWGFYLA